jgi:hypothetical protein
MNNSIFKKLPVALIAAAFLLSFTTTADKANFSGSWKLNESKSELGEFGRFVPKKVKAEQKEDAITISKTTASFDGGDDVTITETLTFDGKTTETTVFGTAKRKSTAKWSEDGKSLAISYSLDFDINGETMTITGTETWSLTNEGKLSLSTKSVSPQGERSTKAVFDKE